MRGLPNGRCEKKKKRRKVSRRDDTQMSDQREKPFSILHHLNAINYLLLLIPVVTLTASISVYYEKKREVFFFLPFFSELTASMPEGRLAIIGLSAESFILMFVLYVREKVVLLVRKQQPKTNEKRFTIAHRIMKVSAYVFVPSHMVASFFNFRNFMILHAIAINIMMYSFVVYAFTGDMVYKVIGHPTKKFSRILTMLIFAMCLTFLALRYYVPVESGDGIRISIANFFGIFALLLIYMKVFVTKFDIPEYGIRLSKKISVQ